MKTVLPAPWLLAAAALCFASCGQEPAATDGNDQRAAAAQGAAEVVDAEVAPYQRELLELAFRAASKFPANPHKKNRGAAQEKVVVACFELDLPRMALGFAPNVEGWRRGMAYADYAWYSARNGVKKDVADYIALAEKVVEESMADPNGQDWRADKVKLKIARAWDALGEVDKAHAVAAEISADSTGAVDQGWTATMSSRVDALTPELAEQELKRITDTFLDQPLGAQYTSLMLLSGMHGRYFTQPEFRAACEERILDRFDKLPANLRLDAMAPLARHYAHNEDVAGGERIVTRMSELIGRATWRAEDRTPEVARIAELRAVLGQRERANRELEEEVQSYFEERDDLIDIYRCETLRPLALAFAEVGDRERALDLLATALEEGMENPNSRPRCDDLVETLVAMATRRVEPSEQLLARIREIIEGLGDPW